MMKEKLNLKSDINWPAPQFPQFRSSYAIQQGIEKNLILVTWGGLGDQICAEPTLRWAIKAFKNCDVSLASEAPELFRHLEFKDVFDLKREQPLWDKYFPFQMIRPPTDLTWQFLNHMLVNCVDYPSLCAFSCQIPVADREVTLRPSDFAKSSAQINGFNYARSVAVHPGRHWQSKTFPKKWWDAVLSHLIDSNVKPILIGDETDDNRGTVEVDSRKCLDLRGKLLIMESVALLQCCKVLLTNDSAPLHMAASGDAWIGFIATAKHPDMITHWRNGEWGWRMKNHGKGGIWDVIDYCPNQENEVSAENVGDHLLDWLPDPVEYAQWAIDKLE